MFSSIRSFLDRHKRKFIITGAVFGGLYLLTSYTQRKLREWQANEAKKFFEMTRKRQHFENTERTCNQTILSLSKVISDSILEILDTDSLVKKLESNPPNKVELWEQLKIIIITRICVLVYALCILQVTVRVQINTIGGYLYKESSQEEGSLVDSQVQTEYLSLCHHFVRDGVKDLVQQIEKAVKKVLEPIPLTKTVTLQEVEQMLWSIQTIMCTDTEGDPVKKMALYLIGPKHITSPKLDTLVKETMDLLESDEVTSIAMSTVSRSFSSVIDEVATLFVSKSVAVTKNQLEVGDDQFVDVNKVKLHLVKLLPVMDQLVTKNMCKDNSNLPTLLTQQLTLNKKLQLLGANIYEVFSSSSA